MNRSECPNPPTATVYHIDLSDGPELTSTRLRAAAQHNEVMIVWWWRAIPLSHSIVQRCEEADGARVARPIALEPGWTAILETARFYRQPAPLADPPDDSSEAVLAHLHQVLSPLDDAVAPVSNQAASAGTAELPVSLIIPTCKRMEALKKCLQSVAQLTRQPEEVIVVDNCPEDDGTRTFMQGYPNVRYVAEPCIGASAARNRGVQVASGKIVAFLDDDELVHPDWLTHLVEHFANNDDPDLTTVTGLVLPTGLDTDAQILFEQRFSFIRGYVPRRFDTEFYAQTRHQGVPTWQIGGSGNLAMWRSTFMQLGGFDELLGGGRAGCSEDTELFYRVLAHGGTCLYAPQAVVYHEHRADLAQMTDQAFQYMRGHVTALLIQFVKQGDWGNLYRLFVVLPTYYLHCVLRSAIGRADSPRRLLWAEIAGCFSGLRFAWQQRRAIAQIRQNAPRSDLSGGTPSSA